MGVGFLSSPKPLHLLCHGLACPEEPPFTSCGRDRSSEPVELTGFGRSILLPEGDQGSFERRGSAETDGGPKRSPGSLRVVLSWHSKCLGFLHRARQRYSSYRTGEEKTMP